MEENIEIVGLSVGVCYGGIVDLGAAEMQFNDVEFNAVGLRLFPHADEAKNLTFNYATGDYCVWDNEFELEDQGTVTLAQINRARVLSESISD